MMYLHAYRSRRRLGLDEMETAHTPFSLQEQVINVEIDLLSLAVAALGGLGLVPRMAMACGLIGPARLVHGPAVGRRIDRLRGPGCGGE